jgi:hypothetical protein
MKSNALLLCAVLVLVLLAGAVGAAATSQPPAPPALPMDAPAVLPPSELGLPEALFSDEQFTFSELNRIGNVFRLSGANRFETAAAVSQGYWTRESAMIVGLATGENYPDALALGGSNALLGPTLLVTRSSLPAVTAAELDRLQPCAIVAAGAAGVIADAVLAQADRYTNPAKCQPPSAPSPVPTATPPGD